MNPSHVTHYSGKRDPINCPANQPTPKFMRRIGTLEEKKGDREKETAYLKKQLERMTRFQQKDEAEANELSERLLAAQRTETGLKSQIDELLDRIALIRRNLCGCGVVPMPVVKWIEKVVDGKTKEDFK